MRGDLWLFFIYFTKFIRFIIDLYDRCVIFTLDNIIILLGTWEMLTIQIENQKKLKDTKVIEAFQQMIELYPEDTIDTAWTSLSSCQFDGYRVGRGGRHIFVIRKVDDTRIMLITAALNA